MRRIRKRRDMRNTTALGPGAARINARAWTRQLSADEAKANHRSKRAWPGKINGIPKAEAAAIQNPGLRYQCMKYFVMSMIAAGMAFMGTGSSALCAGDDCRRIFRWPSRRFRSRSFEITDFGAVGDGKTFNTDAISQSDCRLRKGRRGDGGCSGGEVFYAGRLRWIAISTCILKTDRRFNSLTRSQDLKVAESGL